MSEYNLIGNLFSQFPISSSYGNLIKIESTIDSQISFKEGIYSEIIISLWTQENDPLVINDNDLTIILIISTD